MSARLTLIIMGVAGSGKSTVGQLLATKLGYPFVEGDDFHSIEAKALMASGTPLTSTLRQQWVDRLAAMLADTTAQGQPCVLSYSGLIASQRQQLRQAGQHIRFIYLQGPAEVLAMRLAERSGHYMPASLLQSQLDSMQSSSGETDVQPFSIDQPVKLLIQQILLWLTFAADLPSDNP
ncbi:carbohydrate kinase [Rheinheimera riviphila]|uniref:Gluconokinase n=1 Tax=Rheinheimera riviphila TaxID=1834037 RepID=A0A437R0X2_9GAMM|nr:gluconokinase, GntK/IdnK-type [Rheinheimera riviphila]RVU40426.1 carbohydrate kinase [Rheinheimera riviphila]